MKATRIKKLKEKLEKLSNQREKNVNRYIVPLDIKMQILRDKIREEEPEYNEF